MKHINTLAMAVGKHRFILTYRDGKEGEAGQALGRWAANRELPEFTWRDAFDGAWQIRQLKQQGQSGC